MNHVFSNFSMGAALAMHDPCHGGWAESYDARVLAAMVADLATSVACEVYASDDEVTIVRRLGVAS